MDTLTTLSEGPSFVELLVSYLAIPAHSAIKMTVSRASTSV
jgi:hypothetical protein